MDDFSSDEKRSVLIVASIAAFLTPFMGFAVNVALLSISATLNLSALALNWVSTVYLLIAAIFLLLRGRLSDIFGRKNFFCMG